MINRPEILFADEPTGALNRSTSEDVMQELNKLNREGTTIMLVTHDMKVAAKCSRILYIVDGNIKGELHLGIIGESQLETSQREKIDKASEVKFRERKLNNWLIEMGW